MINKETLLEMAKIDIEEVDINNLVDLNDINIDVNLPKKERILKYIEEIKNPYIYKCGKVIVKVSFKKTERTLNDQFENYLSML